MVSNIDTSTAAGQIDAQTLLNRINQNLPGGSLQFTGPGRSTANLTLSPELQRLFDARVGVSGQALDAASLGLEDFAAGTDAARTRAEEASFNRLFNLTSPELQRREEATRTRLINRGLDERGEAFRDILGAEVLDPNQRILESLALASVGEGRNEVTSQIANLNALLGLQQEEPANLRDFFAPNAIDVLGPEQLRFNQNVAGQNAQIQQDQIKALEDAQKLGGLTTIGATLITAAIGKGGLGGFLKDLGITQSATLGGAVKDLFSAAASAGSSVVDFLAGTLGGGAEAVQGAAELLQGAIPGIDTNLITGPASQSITGIPGAVDVASIPGNVTDVGQGLIGGAGAPQAAPEVLSTFAGNFTLDPTTGAAIGSAGALNAAGLIGAGEATALANAGFTAAEIAGMNQLLATTSTAGTGAAGAGLLATLAPGALAAGAVFATPSIVKAARPIVQDFGDSLSKLLGTKSSNTPFESGQGNIEAARLLNTSLEKLGLDPITEIGRATDMRTDAERRIVQAFRNGLVDMGEAQFALEEINSTIDLFE